MYSSYHRLAICALHVPMVPASFSLLDAGIGIIGSDAMSLEIASPGKARFFFCLSLGGGAERLAFLLRCAFYVLPFRSREFSTAQIMVQLLLP